MKNKGFTLIELLIVIVILGTVGTIVTVSLTKSVEKQRIVECKAFIEEIEDATSVYTGLSDSNCQQSDGECEISIQSVYERGLISSEVNSCNGKKIEEDTELLNKKVTVIWINNEKRSCLEGDTYSNVELDSGRCAIYE